MPELSVSSLVAEPLDLSQPLEFDNGVPVVLDVERTVSGSGRFYASSREYPVRGSGMKGFAAYEYDQVTGIFCGGNREQFYVVRNVASTEPEEYEGWFVA